MIRSLSSERTPVALVALVMVLCTLLFPGCGKRPKTSWVGEASAFFQEARAKTMGIDSMRIEGDIEIRYGMGGADMTISADYEGLVRNTHERGMVGLMKVSTRMGGDGSGVGAPMEFNVYTEGNKVYTQIPGEGRWVYREFDPREMWGGIGQDPFSVNPQGIIMTLDAARSIELVEESEDYAVFSFRLDAEKLLTEDTVRNMKEGLSQFGGRELSAEEIKSAFLEMLGLIKFSIKLDRNSLLPLEITEESDGNLLEVIGRFVPEAGMAQGGSMGMRASFRFSDYGADFTVERPPGIDQATPLGK